MLIGFTICDGRHVAADEESALLYRMYMAECIRSIAVRSSSLRHRRRHSLVFIVIIADECRKRKESRASQCKRQKEKANYMEGTHTPVKRPDSNQRLLLDFENE